MRSSSTSARYDTHDVVFIGGGHAHALALRQWGMAPVRGARLTVINPGPTAPYTGMLPGYVAGHYARDALDIDLVKLCRFAGARLVLGRATEIDRIAKRIRVPGRADIAYDLASLDVGIGSALPEIPGFQDHAVAAKPLGPFADAWDRFLDAVASGAAAPEIAVIGGGVGGIELAMAMAHRLRSDERIDVAPTVTVLEAANRPLLGVGAAATASLLRRLDALGVALKTNADVVRIADDHVSLARDDAVRSRFTVGAAGARPQAWLADTGLDLLAGYVAVDETLRSTNDPSVYAAGDCAHMTAAPRPKAGVFAVRQAPILYANLKAEVLGEPRRPYRPQRDYLKLISVGEKAAVADKNGLRLEGGWVWRLKDRIDRKFMDRLGDLPTMAPPDGDEARRPLCAGCGAKIGRPALLSALETLPPPSRPDVLRGAGDDAALLRVGDQTQVMTTDHLRAFTQDPWLLSRIAANHAMSDVWAMGAQPQAALASIVLPESAEKLQSESLREVLDAASDAVRAAGADLVGGHSTLGAELQIGFSVAGLVGDRPIGLDGARPGDVLILTKPIGVGVILAADMAMKAKGGWVATAWERMARSSGPAAALLATEAQAMTDVTGFGLAGHLMAMLEASGVAARLDLAAIPVLDGAETLAAEGVRSSLWLSNAAVAERVRAPAVPKTDLLYDPQTAGGLLAAVPVETADALLERLANAGEAAARIGIVVERTDVAPWIIAAA